MEEKNKRESEDEDVSTEQEYFHTQGPGMDPGTTDHTVQFIDDCEHKHAVLGHTTPSMPETT